MKQAMKHQLWPRPDRSSFIHCGCGRPHGVEQRNQTCCLCSMTMQMSLQLCQETRATLRVGRNGVNRSLMPHENRPSSEQVESSRMSLAPACGTRGPCLTNIPRCLSSFCVPYAFLLTDSCPSIYTISLQNINCMPSQ